MFHVEQLQKKEDVMVTDGRVYYCKKAGHEDVELIYLKWDRASCYYCPLCHTPEGIRAKVDEIGMARHVDVEPIREVL